MTVGKVVTVFGLTIAVVCALLILARPEFFLGSLLALYMAGLGITVWVVGWIIQGFLADRSRRSLVGNRH
jgi:hypothetical protein